MPLTMTKRLASGQMLKRYRLPSTELTAAAVTQAVPLFTLPADALVSSVTVDLVTDFTDAGSISSVTFQVGSAGDPNSFFTALEGMSGSPANKRYEQKGVWESGDGLAVQCLATATGANLGDGTDTSLDGGAIDIDVIYSRAR